MTREELAFNLKQKYPQLVDHSPDEIVDSFLRVHPEFAAEIVDQPEAQPAQPVQSPPQATLQPPSDPTDQRGPMTRAFDDTVQRGIRGFTDTMAQGVTGLDMTARKLTGHGFLPVDNPESYYQALEPRDTAGKVGGAIERGLEFVGPGIASGGAATLIGAGGKGAIPFLARNALQGAGDAAWNATRSGGQASGAENAAIGATSAFGGMSMETLAKAAKFLKRSGLRNIKDLMNPSKPRDLDLWAKTAQRAVDEGLVPFASNQETAGAAGKALLPGAEADKIAAKQAAAGQQVDMTPVMETAMKNFPDTGVTERSSRSATRAADAVYNDVAGYIDRNAVRSPVTLQGPGVSHTLPFEAADRMKGGWQDFRSRELNRGQLGVSATKEPGEKVSLAIHKTMADAFPDVNTANLRQSELLDVTRMLEDEAARLDREGLTASTSAAGIAGTATGRKFVPVDVLLNMTFRHPRWITSSAATKRAVSDIIQGGHVADWLRLAAEGGIASQPDKSEDLRALGINVQ